MSVLEGVITGLFGLGSAGINAAATHATNKANLQAVRETNDLNQRLTQLAWDREDNAVQRRAADLAKSGFSPLLAAGSAAASSGPANMIAPRYEQEFKMDTVLSGIAQGMNLHRQLMDIEAQQQQIELSRGRLELQNNELNRKITNDANQLKLDTAKHNLSAYEAAQRKLMIDTQREHLQEKILDMHKGRELQEQNYEIGKHNLKISKDANIRTTDPYYVNSEQFRRWFSSLSQALSNLF